MGFLPWLSRLQIDYQLIGRETAEELRNGQTEGQIQIIVWFTRDGKSVKFSR